MRRPGIHFRLLFLALLLIGSAISILGYLGNKMVQDFVETRFEERIDFLARYLARNAELGILINDQTMLEQLSENLLQESDVVTVSIFNAQGETLAEVSSTEAPGPLYSTRAEVHMERIEGEDLQLPGWQSSKPHQEIIGSVRIDSSMKNLQRLQHNLQNRFLFLALAVTAVTMIFFFWLSKSLVNPIRRLVGAAEKVTRGEHDTRAVPDSIPETRTLAESFNTMLDSLEWSNRALEEAYQEMMQQRTLAELGKFAMTIAHEVKNPLGIIKSSVDVLKKDYQFREDDLIVSYIDDEIKRLNRLIEDFLFFSRPAKPSFQWVELNSLVVESLERFQVQFEGQSVDFSTELCQGHSAIQGDRDLLIRTFHNLLKNSVEANGFVGTVVVRTRVQDVIWLLEIEDEGDGISSEVQDRVFEPFFTTRSKGTGLGLSFVSQVVTAHNGQVDIHNGRDRGAVVTVRLPLPAGPQMLNGDWTG
jgi:signal transduction histidine kinase/cell division protein FtsB